MSMRMSISPAAMAVLAGCGVTATTEYTATDPPVLAAISTGQAGQVLTIIKCPDPRTDCTHSNGTGVFFEEGGDASVNPSVSLGNNMTNIPIMITEFTNHGSWVTCRGRYADPSMPGRWLWADGTVDSADYGTEYGLRVVGLSEERTKPTWMLVDRTSTLILVTGDLLLALKLHVTFNVVIPPPEPPMPSVPPVPPVRVLLDFDQSDIIVDTDPQNNPYDEHPVLYAYNLRWRPDVDPLSAPTQYCYRGPDPSAPSAPLRQDQVVFQRGIIVDPVTGRVTSDPNAVTMSCAWGAVAKAYNFGYAYVDPRDGSAFDRFFYEAAIHMKRAAYCGGADTYTIAGVRIGIHDNLGINQYPRILSAREARWSPDGASCLNLRKRRYPPRSFDGRCTSGWSPQQCDPPTTPTYLEDYIPPPP